MVFKIVYAKPNRYYIDGEEVTKKVFDNACPKRDPITEQAVVLMESSKSWPRKSDAVGVGRNQIDAMQALLIKKGVPTEFDRKTGQAIVRNNAHQRDILKALGYHNNEGGYGQITG